jgi:nucleoside-diphosphate-sugar epimerase
VVVTGGAGFVGGAITHALRGRGDEVVALDVVRGPGARPADVSRPGDWEKELAGADLLVHTAAVGMGGVGELPPIRAGRPLGSGRAPADRMRQVLLGGTATVLDAAARAGVGRVLHLSCVCVLGPHIADGVDETAPIGLTGDPRADTLAAAEQAVSAAAASGLPATILRIGDAYGPRAGRWTLWPVLLLRAGRFVLLDGGTGWLNPVHIDDVVAAALAAAASDRTVGETLHVTGPAASTVAEFVRHYSSMLELPDPRSVPARMYTALDDATGVVDRLRVRVESRRGAAGGAGTAGESGPVTTPGSAAHPDAVGPSASTAALGLVRGFGARLGSRVDPRTRMDLGPISVADVTRSGRCAGELITTLTGWRPRVDLADGMSRTQEWLHDRGLLGVREPARRG